MSEENSNIRIKLRANEREVEVEAPLEIAEELAERWWGRLGTERPRDRAAFERPDITKGRTNDAEGGEKDFDPVQVANDVKERAEYEQIEKRVLHTTSRWQKVALILWACPDRFLTSGDIYRILRELGDKIDQPGVSNSLRDNQSLLQASGSRAKGKTVAYRLTGKAFKEFHEWLTAA